MYDSIYLVMAEGAHGVEHASVQVCHTQLEVLNLVGRMGAQEGARFRVYTFCNGTIQRVANRSVRMSLRNASFVPPGRILRW